MTSFTEGRHSAEFIMSDANGQLSYEVATVLSGEDLDAGEVVMADGDGKLLAHDGLINTAGEVITAVKGIMYSAVDATAGDVVGAAYLARLAEVNNNILTYPAETSPGGERAGVNADMAANLNIVAR